MCYFVFIACLTRRGGRLKRMIGEGREIPETGCPTKTDAAMHCSLTDFLLLFDYAYFETYTR